MSSWLKATSLKTQGVTGVRLRVEFIADNNTPTTFFVEVPIKCI